jgi:hypothetical protein
VARSNKLPLWLRWIGLGAGALTLVWLPIEDTRTSFLTILAILWTVWTGAFLSIRPKLRAWFGGGQWRGTTFGAGVGLLVFPVSLGLVFFKAAVHAHGFLDFSGSQLLGLLNLVPVWVAIGALAGWVVGKRA